jgi:hypothetical protein
VSRLEDRYRLRLPEDFRRYLLEAAPSEDLWDDGDATWWSLGRVKNIPDEHEHAVSDLDIAGEAASCLFFADYLIWCWAWAVCCSEGPNRGKVALIGGSPDRFVANSFSEFIDQYLVDPYGLCNHPPISA